MYYLTIRKPQTRRPVFYVRTKSESATAKMWIMSIVHTAESKPIGGKVVESRRFRKPELALQWISKMAKKYGRLSMWWCESTLNELRKAAS